MKRFFLIFAVILIFNYAGFSQDKAERNASDKKITIQANPLLLFSDIFVIDYDYDHEYDFRNKNSSLFAMDLETQIKLTNYTNLSFTVSFLAGKYTVKKYYDYYNEDIYSENVFQINIKPMYIHRPFETGLKGAYIGFYPIFGLSYINNNNNEDEMDNRYFAELGFGITTGYKWVFKSGFTMQLGGGLGKTFVLPERPEYYLPLNSDGRLSIGLTDIQILEFKIGYSF